MVCRNPEEFIRYADNEGEQEEPVEEFLPEGKSIGDKREDKDGDVHDKDDE